MLGRSLLRGAARIGQRHSNIQRYFAHPPPFRIPVASFHSSSRRQDEVPKSPFQTFVDVLREELRKNRELQENVKQLQGDVDKFQDSEAMKRARAAYERARVRRNGQVFNWVAAQVLAVS
jgi:import inner membrane translocase subunit TIM44